MCLVCSEWELGKLTNKEALRNLGELIRAEDRDNGEDNGHYYQVVDKIMDDELGESSSDDEIDAAWHKETHQD